MKARLQPVHQALVINQILSRLRASVPSLVGAASAVDAVEAGDLVAAATADGAALQRIRMLPIGTITLRDGRGPFTVADQAHAQAIVDASLAYAGNRDIPFDYDHQLLHAIGPGKGGNAPAAGWVKRLTAEADGIYADVQWTDAAAAKLGAREYRYISPTFAFDKASGRITAIRYGSLVNDNAIDELLAVASTQETPLETTKIAAALGLEATATVDDILAAIVTLSVGKPDMAAAAAALGLAADADATAIVAAASSLVAAAENPDPAKWVPASAHADTLKRLGELQAIQRESIIAAATAEGRLTPAMAAVARDHLTDQAAFDAYIAAAAIVVAPGKLPKGNAADQDDLAAAASTYIAEQAGNGITIDAASAVRHVLSTRSL